MRLRPMRRSGGQHTALALARGARRNVGGGRPFSALNRVVLGCFTRSTMSVDRIGAIRIGAIKQDGYAPFSPFSSLSSQYRCCFCIRQLTMHSLAQVPGIRALSNPRPFSHDGALRSRLDTTRENLIATTGPMGQSYSIANPNGSETRRHSERLQDPEDLAADSVIGAQATERDAPLRAVVHKSASAVIAPRLAPIAHVQLAAAMATAQKSSEKQLAATHRPSDRGTALTGRIVGNHLLVPLELAPGDITLVLILEQHVPFGHWAPHAAIDALAAVLDAYFAHRAAKGIGASIDGVGQDVVDRVVERQPPSDAAPLRRLVACDRQRNAFVSHPHVHLTNAVEFANLGEDQPEGVLHPLVRILLDPIAPSPHIACLNTQQQRTAP